MKVQVFAILFFASALVGCSVAPDIAFEEPFGMTAEFREDPETLVPIKGDECCARRSGKGACEAEIPQCVPWAKAPIDERSITRR